MGTGSLFRAARHLSHCVFRMSVKVIVSPKRAAGPIAPERVRAQTSPAYRRLPKAIPR